MLPSRVLLIGGPSHAGKSTLAEALITKLGRSHVSTDSLACHPGRPWKTEERVVPEHVVEHYSSLSVDELVEDVMRHYSGLWPDIEPLVQTQLANSSDDPGGLVLEGSALLPGLFAGAELEGVAACWLTADDDVLESRIHASSGFDNATPDEQALIQKFVQRNRIFNALTKDAVNAHSLNSIDTGNVSGVDALIERCIELVQA